MCREYESQFSCMQSVYIYDDIVVVVAILFIVILLFCGRDKLTAEKNNKLNVDRLYYITFSVQFSRQYGFA